MTPVTAIRVISLKESKDRRVNFSQHISGHDLDWSFFCAHQGIVSPLSYNDREALKTCGRSLLLQEIGAYASHFKCWEWLANSIYDQAIILEDDVTANWQGIAQLSRFHLSSHAIDLLRLFATHPISCKIVMYRFLSPNCHLVRTTGWHLGMQGYMLTKEGACRLVEKYPHITAPVDWILTRYWEHRLGNYSLFPFPIIEENLRSTICPRNSATYAPFVDRAIRFWRRGRDRINREYYDHWTAKRWPLGPTIDAGPAFIESGGLNHD